MKRVWFQLSPLSPAGWHALRYSEGRGKGVAHILGGTL
jgi:hypothetical protein